MSGIILKTYSIETSPSPRYTHTIRIKLGCLLNATGPGETAFGGADAEILLACGEGFGLTQGTRCWSLSEMDTGTDESRV